MQDLYNKERARVRNLINRYIKKGFTFTKPIIPKIPKVKNQESIDELKKITPQFVRSKAKVLRDTSATEQRTKKKGRKKGASFFGDAKGKKGRKGSIAGGRKGKKKTTKGKVTKPKTKPTAKPKSKPQEPEAVLPKSYWIFQSFKDQLNKASQNTMFNGAVLCNAFFDSLIAKYGEEKVAEIVDVAIAEGMNQFIDFFDSEQLRNPFMMELWILEFIDIMQRELNDDTIMEDYMKQSEKMYDQFTDLEQFFGWNEEKL